MNNPLPENERAVWVLKTMGKKTMRVLAETMNVNVEGARFQLLKLATDGLVEATTVSKGRGRPQQIWSLTARGHARFPDTHADLTVKLIRKMRETLGEAAVQAVIAANGKDSTERYLKELEGVKGLESRVKKLAEIRSREGYMAEYEKEAGGFLLVENHCPICAAATACQGFCQSELSAFRKVLKADVERVSHILDGARHCAYKIKLHDQI